MLPDGSTTGWDTSSAPPKLVARVKALTWVPDSV
jgi:hypothetical protein